MTRINLIPPSDLCDQHLLGGEWRELKRIPNHVVKTLEAGRWPNLENRSNTYVLGKGHVRFFYDKLGFLYNRYLQILKELDQRGMPQENHWPDYPIPEELMQDYEPSEAEIQISVSRIEEMMPKKPRWSKNND